MKGSHSSFLWDVFCIWLPFTLALSCPPPALWEDAVKGVLRIARVSLHSWIMLLSLGDVPVHVREFSQPLLSTLQVIQQHRGIPLNDCQKPQLANSEAWRVFSVLFWRRGFVLLSPLSLHHFPAEPVTLPGFPKQGDTGLKTASPDFSKESLDAAKGDPEDNSLSLCLFLIKQMWFGLLQKVFSRHLGTLQMGCILSSCKCLQTALFVPVALSSLYHQWRGAGIPTAWIIWSLLDVYMSMRQTVSQKCLFLPIFHRQLTHR